ncbi:MAG TPA: RNA methyltransferase [Polyangiaceae bacterium]|nr:RNA methyltransferase [Polyangiaceae bacterium]
MNPSRPDPRRRPAEPAPLPQQRGPRLVLGLQPVRAAIRAHGARLGGVVLESADNPRLAAVERYAKDQGVEVVEVVGRASLDRLAGGVLHQGVGAWAPDLANSEFGELLTDAQLLGVVLDRIQDPQNFGAVLRSSVGFCAGAVVWGEHSSAPLGPATLRAAAGAAEFARLCRVASLPRALAEAADAGVQVIGLDAQADRALAAWDLRGPTLLVIGSEQSGMTPAVRKACTGLARLVAPGPIESLNASVAAAIALYEATRQRAISDR